MEQPGPNINPFQGPRPRQRLPASALVLASLLIFSGAARIAWGELWGGLTVELWVSLLLPSTFVLLALPRLVCAFVTAVCAIATYGLLAGNAFDWSTAPAYSLFWPSPGIKSLDVVMRSAFPGSVLAFGTWWLVRRSYTGRPVWLSP